MTLTYPSIHAVLPYMGMKNRLKLAKKCPETRKALQNLPFHVKTLSAQGSKSFLFEKQEIVIQIDGNIQWKFGNVNENTLKLKNPFGKSMEVPKSDCPRFFRYYFQRPGTIIWELILKDFHSAANRWLFELPRLKLRALKLDFHNVAYGGGLKHLKGVMVQCVEVVEKKEGGQREECGLLDDLRLIKADHFDIKVSNTDFDITRLTPLHSMFYHENRTEMSNFLNCCSKIKNSHTPLNIYSGQLHDLNSLDTTELWNQLKNRLGGKMEQSGGRKYLRVPIFGSRTEVLVVTCEPQWNYWRPVTVLLTARVVEKYAHPTPTSKWLATLTYLLCFFHFHICRRALHFYDNSFLYYRALWMLLGLWQNYESDILLLITSQIIIYLVWTAFIEFRNWLIKITGNSLYFNLSIHTTMMFMRSVNWVIHKIFKRIGLKDIFGETN